MLPTAQDFEHSLATMQQEKGRVEFNAQDVTVENASWLEAQAKRVLSGAVQVMTALTIPTPVGSVIVSLTTTRTTPTMTTSYALTAKDEFLRALRSMEQQNPRLPQ